MSHMLLHYCEMIWKCQIVANGMEWQQVKESGINCGQIVANIFWVGERKRLWVYLFILFIIIIIICLCGFEMLGLDNREWTLSFYVDFLLREWWRIKKAHLHSLLQRPTKLKVATWASGPTQVLLLLQRRT